MSVIHHTILLETNKRLSCNSVKPLLCTDGIYKGEYYISPYYNFDIVYGHEARTLISIYDIHYKEHNIGI